MEINDFKQEDHHHQNLAENPPSYVLRLVFSILNGQFKVNLSYFVLERPLDDLIVISGDITHHDESHHTHHLEMDLIRGDPKNSEHLHNLNIELYDQFQKANENWYHRSFKSFWVH